MTLRAPNGPTNANTPPRNKDPRTIANAIRDLEELAGGMYDLPGGVDRLYTIAASLKALADCIEKTENTTREQTEAQHDSDAE